MGKVVFGGPERTGVAPLSGGFCCVHELIRLARLTNIESMISFDDSINFENVRSAEPVKANILHVAKL
jgi:hypothetical protein